MELLKTLQNKIDDLSLRERGIVLLGIIAVIYFLADLFLLEPLAIQQQRVLSGITLNNAELLALNVRMELIMGQSSIDPNAVNKEELKRLKQELARLDAELQMTTAQLVPPKEMPKLLEMVLRRTEGLRLNKVNSLAAEPLIANGEAKATGATASDTAGNATTQQDNGTVSTVYRHGLRIEFSGDFPGTLNYLRKLEELQWKFFWDKIEFEVNEYPDSACAISVYTISMNDQWIGV